MLSVIMEKYKFEIQIWKKKVKVRFYKAKKILITYFSVFLIVNCILLL